MIQPIDAPAGVVALEAVGKIDATDHESVLRPAIERNMAEQTKARVVFVLGPGFERYTAGAAWEDLKLWAPHLTSWERCAVVTDHDVLAGTIRAFAIVMPGDVKVFPVDELDEALAWAAG